MKESIVAFAIAGALVWLGSRILKLVRRAKETGIADFPMQWPNRFPRDGDSWNYHYTVMLYTVIACICYVMAVAAIINGVVNAVKSVLVL